MQILKTYFENDNLQIFAQLADIGTFTVGSYPLENKIVYSNKLALYTGVNNPIRIQCLNSDQQRVNTSNVTVQVGLFEANTQNELIKYTASNVDNANGIVSVNFLPSDLAPLNIGFYEVTVSAVDTNGNVFPVYIDDNFGNRLTVQLFKGPVFAYPDPVPVTFIDIGHKGVMSGQINLTNRPMNSTTATLQIEFIQPYTGNITSQGSLVSIPMPNDFANINSVNYSNANGIIFQNVLGSFAVIQFVVDDIDPQGWGNIQVSDWINNANIRY